jgi:hypothetical protein
MCGEKLALISLRLVNISSREDPALIVSQYLSAFLGDSLIEKELVMNINPVDYDSVCAFQSNVAQVIRDLTA